LEPTPAWKSRISCTNSKPARSKASGYFLLTLSIRRQEELLMPLGPVWFSWKIRFAPLLGWQGLVISPLEGGAGEHPANPRQPSKFKGPGAGSPGSRNAVDAVHSRRWKTLAIRPPEWEIPTMTVVTHNKKRVTLRLAKPGDRFDVQVVSDGNYILTKLEPV
jgi:hypothetical protein